jgi:hypothetical protein
MRLKLWEIENRGNRHGTQTQKNHAYIPTGCGGKYSEQKNCGKAERSIGASHGKYFHPTDDNKCR